MNVKDIVEAYLKANGYDGLYNDERNCACGAGNLMRCYRPFPTCSAGYKVPCDCGEHNFHIVEDRPLNKAQMEELLQPPEGG